MSKAFTSMTKRSQKGFTLIELLVVIAIIAILAALILAALNAAQKGARDSQRLSDLNQIKTALVNYDADNGSYPTTAAGLAATSPTYLNPVPTAPQQGPTGARSYQYFQGSTSGFVTCVQSERDTSKWFWATSTGTDKNASAVCTAANGK